VDAFTFKPSMAYDRDKQLTKRDCLRIIMSIFDPLGLVAPVVIGGNLLLKEVWADKTLGYDNVIPRKQKKKFFDWCEELSNLSKVKVPRCFLKHTRELVRRTLHVFTDASQVGYGAAAYVRNVFRDGITHNGSICDGKGACGAIKWTNDPTIRIERCCRRNEISN